MIEILAQEDLIIDFMIEVSLILEKNSNEKNVRFYNYPKYSRSSHHNGSNRLQYDHAHTRYHSRNRYNSYYHSRNGYNSYYHDKRYDNCRNAKSTFSSTYRHEYVKPITKSI